MNAATAGLMHNIAVTGSAADLAGDRSAALWNAIRGSSLGFGRLDIIDPPKDLDWNHTNNRPVSGPDLIALVNNMSQEGVKNMEPGNLLRMCAEEMHLDV